MSTTSSPASRATQGSGPSTGFRERLNAALVTAVAVALLTLVATLIRVNERDLTFTLSAFDTFSYALGIYLLPTTVLAVVLIAAGLLGAFRNWFLAGVAGLLGGLLGGVVGYVQQIIAGGLELNGEAWAAIFLEFFGNNFAFLAFATLLTGALAPIVANRQLQQLVQGRADSLADPRRFSQAAEKLAYVRVPASSLGQGAAQPLDQERAADQWEAYVELLERYGWSTREVPAAETLPSGVFTGDQAVILDEVVLLARPGTPARQLELPTVRAAIVDEGFVVEEVEQPAALDGGDVLVSGDTVFVGASKGSNAAGIRALRQLAGGLGYNVVAVPLDGEARLRQLVSALPDGTLLLWPERLAQQELLGRAIRVPEELGAAVLPLDGETVAVSAAAPQTASLVEQLGYRVERLDIAEFERLGGRLGSLSLRGIG